MRSWLRTLKLVMSQNYFPRVRSIACLLPVTTNAVFGGRQLLRASPKAYGLLILLVILFSSTFSITCASGENMVTLVYRVSVFLSQTSYYEGSPYCTFDVKVVFEEKSGSYIPKSLSVIPPGDGGIVCVGLASSFKTLIEAPGLDHFAINPKLLHEVKERNRMKIGDVKYVFMTRSAVSLGDNRMEEGYQLILFFGKGAKEVLYDDDSGLLLSEFYIVEKTFGPSYIVYMRVVKAPSFIGDEGVSRTAIRAFQAVSTIILLMALAAVAVREKYRVL